MDFHHIVVFGGTSNVGKTIIWKAIERGCSQISATECPEKFNDLRQFMTSVCAKYPKVSFNCFELDVNSVERIEQRVDEIFAVDPLIDLCVYTIGKNEMRPAISVTEEIWDSIVNVNLKGFFFCAKTCAKRMMKNRRGSIVGISSQHGVVGNVERAPYCASKAGMINLVKALALEWGKYGIRVNVVSPTFIEDDRNTLLLHKPQFIREWLSNIPLHRYATADDVASAVLFVLSDESNMITGQNLIVDGGWTAK